MGMSVVLFSTGWSPREDRIRRMLRPDIPVLETWDVPEMKALIETFGIEALNTHQWHIQNYPSLVPDVFNKLQSHVASLHGMIEHGTAFPITEQQLRQADANVTVWVYTADKNVQPFVDIGLFDPASPRFKKLPNGMHPPQIRPESRAALGIPKDAFVLCCVSRAIPDKGWAEAIQVVEKARALSGRDIHLILVGNGVVYDDLCNKGVPGFVHLVGFHENSVGHYAIADMGIMLTWFRSESFPLTIVDCLFAGRPYIATDVGEIRNTLTTPDGVAGAVISLRDWTVPIDAAAEVVARFASDRDAYMRAAALVPEIAGRYHIDKVAAEYLRLFRSGLGLPGADAPARASESGVAEAIGLTGARDNANGDSA
jgi:glycosyltransferase involved in cell wall biosynthesis